MRFIEQVFKQRSRGTSPALQRVAHTPALHFAAVRVHRLLPCCACTLQVKDALDLLDHHRDPLASTRMRVSLAGLMVLTAEGIRDQGLPDWMQVWHCVRLGVLSLPWPDFVFPAVSATCSVSSGG